MNHNYQLLCCTVALGLCSGQLFAQNAILKPGSSGLQAYHMIKKWRGLDIQSYLAGIGLFGGSQNTATGTQALYPFTGSTVIGYSLPKGASSAQKQITDVTGKVLALIPLSSGDGKNMLTANVSGYASGTYNYSLIVNGQLVGTKQMTAIR